MRSNDAVNGPFQYHRVTYGVYILKAFRFVENLADLFFLLLPHKFSSIAYVRLVNFNAEKRKKKEQRIRNPRGFVYISR
jgi:hypothetical protein